MSVDKLVLGSREEWLQARKNHIGGSDASACVGVNPYKSNVDLWEEKTGLRQPEDISGKDYVIYGTRAEGHLREFHEEEYFNLLKKIKGKWYYLKFDIPVTAESNAIDELLMDVR